MNAWKKRGATLMLAGAAVLIGTILTVCDSTAAPEKIAPPASQGVPSEPETAAEEGTSIESPPVSPAEDEQKPVSENPSAVAGEEPVEEPLRILVESDTQRIVFRLNGSPAAKDLYRQLPFTVSVENYGSNEKIFYPPERLSTEDTPIAQGPAGTLTYYAPWGDVAMFYSPCGGSESLYQLGEAISGGEQIESLTGEIRVSQLLGDDLPDEELREGTAMKMQVQVGEQIFTATLEDNAATEALVEMMKAAPVELSMSDYSGFEKVGPLGASLPAEDRQTTTQAGDIVLYTGDQIVIFYGSNSWRYTRLGHIDDLTGWEEALGSGDVTVRLSLKG